MTVGRLGQPLRIFGEFLPTGDRHVTAEDGFFIGQGCIGDGLAGQGGIFHAKHYRAAQAVGAPADPNDDILTGVFSLALADGIAGPGQGGQGLLLGARVGVVPQRRDV